MQSIKNLALFFAGLSLFFFACKKVDDLPFYDEGKPVTLSASKTAVTATAADSTTNVVSFSKAK